MKEQILNSIADAQIKMLEAVISLQKAIIIDDGFEENHRIIDGGKRDKISSIIDTLNHEAKKL